MPEPEKLLTWMMAAAAILCLTLSCDTASAAPQDERDARDAGSDADVAALDLNDAGGWEFRVDPFLWMANIDGTVGGRGATVDVDPGFFDEILDNFDAGGFLGIEGRRDRFFAFGNLNFMELSGDVRPGRSLLDEYDIGTFLSGVDLNIPTPQPPGILPPRLEAIVQQLIADRVTEVKQEVIEALEGVTLGPRLDKVDWDVKLLMVEVAVGFNLGEWELGGADGPETALAAVYMVQSNPFASPAWPVLSVDLYAGARYWDIKWELDMDITPGVLAIVPSSVSKGRSSNWVDPLVGARMDLAFSEDLSLMLRGDIGGFGVGSGSDLAWQVVAGLDWQVNDHMTIGAGYRVVDVDYTDGSGADRTVIDLTFLGPYIGASFAF